jgi:hypothetical protein
VAAALAVFHLAYYILTMAGHQFSSDGFIMFQNARALAADGSILLDPPLKWGGTTHTASKYGIGMTVAYLPLLLPLRVLRPDLFTAPYDPALDYDVRLLHNELYQLASVLNPIIVALLAGLTYLVGLEVGLSRGWAAAAALALGLASPLAVYARLDFAQPLVALLLLAAIWLTLRLTERSPLVHWAGLGLVIGYGILTRFDFIATAAWLSAMAVLTTARTEPAALVKRWVGPAVLAALIGAAIALYLALNALKSGSPFNFGYPSAWVSSLRVMLRGLAGLLASPSAGILVFVPLTWVAGLGLIEIARRRPVMGLVITGIFGTHMLLFSLWRNWIGGYSWGPRFLVPVIPVIILCAMAWGAYAPQSQGQLRRGVLAGLSTAGWLVSLNGILFNFLPFLSEYYARAGQVLRVTEDFSFKASPLFAGWRFSSDLGSYDLFWLNRIAQGGRKTLVVLAGLMVVMAAIGAWLRDLWVKQPRRELRDS